MDVNAVCFSLKGRRQTSKGNKMIFIGVVRIVVTVATRMQKPRSMTFLSLILIPTLLRAWFHVPVLVCFVNEWKNG